MKDYIAIDFNYTFHNYLHVKYEFIPQLVIHFELIRYTHKHVLNEITDTTCSHVDNEY